MPNALRLIALPDYERRSRCAVLRIFGLTPDWLFNALLLVGQF